MKKILRVYKIENSISSSQGCLIENARSKMNTEYFKTDNCKSLQLFIPITDNDDVVLSSKSDYINVINELWEVTNYLDGNKIDNQYLVRALKILLDKNNLHYR